MRARQKWLVYIVLVILVFITALYSILRSMNKFVYSDHLDDTLFTINEQKVSLQEASYYIMIVEEQVNRMAIQYDPEDTSQFWNVHFSAGVDSTFVRTMAKNMSYDLCIYDYIMSQEADQAGVVLSTQEQEETKQEADELYASLSNKTVDVTKFNEEILEELLLRRNLARVYAYSMAETADFSTYDGTPQEELNYDGDYYIDIIKSKYTIKTNKHLWDQISLEDLTI